MPLVPFQFGRENLRATARALVATPKFQKVRAERAAHEAALEPRHRLPATEAEAENWLRVRVVAAYQHYLDPSVGQTPMPPSVHPFPDRGFFCPLWGPVAAVVHPVHGTRPAVPGPDELPEEVVAEVSGPVPEEDGYFVDVMFYTILRG